MSVRAGLAELRALRAAGKKRLSTYEVREEEKLYEEVDEEGYKKIVRERLNQDDFIIDDNGEGYADDGREDWMQERRAPYGSDSEEELPLKGKAAKRKREEDLQKEEKVKNSISTYFNKGQINGPTKTKKPIKTEEDDEFMQGLLGELDHNAPARRVSPPMKAVKSGSRRKTRVLSPPLSEIQTSRTSGRSAKPMDMVHTPPVESSAADEDAFLPMGDDDVVMTDPQLPSSPIAKAMERKYQPKKSDKEASEEEDDDNMEVVETIGRQGAASAKSVNISASRPIAVPKKTDYPSPESSSPIRGPVDGAPSGWADVTSKLNLLSSPVAEGPSFGETRHQDAIEDDGSLHMFWIDYTEVNGSLCLFGKVKDRRSGKYVSCFVKLDNILRKLFFLPRKYRQSNGLRTSDEVDMKDVYEEVDGLMSKMGVGMHKIKPCSRRYAFELPGIPKEAKYLKLLYPYDKPVLPDIAAKGETYSHVFGSNTALFEQFVLWRNIMGPCWLKIEGADFTTLNNVSWCKLEVLVTKPALVSPLEDAENMEPPPLTLMSIALRTSLNVKDNKQEIVLASARIYQDVSLNEVSAPEKLPCRSFCIIRPTGHSFPAGFEALAKKHSGSVKTEKSESALLNHFLAILQNVDPDVLVGHQLEGVDYSVLLSRMRELKTKQWHRIGRLKRNDFPHNMGKGSGSFFAERQLVSGRLLCDLANDLGKSLMTKCQSWSLTEMCDLVLGAGNQRRDIDNEVALKTWATSREGLMNFVTHCEADTYFIAAVALKVQMLPLTKVLTNLAGNSWARTLSGTRAERNEYILLHEFHRNKYICPDKVYGRGKAKMEEENVDGEEGPDVKKKDKYKGGLVFEPERGLYDKFILVMDFNSLYPSIIQEYNICFTTVERSSTSVDDEQVPDVPKDQGQGILPKLIATLVSRRRQVKSLMKSKSASPDQLATWDIKQLALKLTANSMYGCLGYTRSRFYARPLAVLITAKGREILRSTKDLAESNQLQVIYGDTDSVMINTNAETVEAALKVGGEFKRAVNDLYKLLEIDIDNIFRRLLLHAKKKYAAINMTDVGGKYVDSLEVKGLDMKRREYCALSKEASSKLLNEILSGEDPEVVVQKIHDYLRELADKMREDSVPVQKYVIYTKLGKNPTEYPNADSMPQVQVALREISRGKTVRANDVMSYIVTGNSNSKETSAKRAYTLQDVMQANSGLKPDVEWYLYKQIFPPVERLCAPIDGTDAVRLAECLGLDTRKYQISSSSAQADQEIFPLESQIPDEVRFKDATKLNLCCRSCKGAFPFEGIAASTSACSADGIVCPNESCGRSLPAITVVAQLENQIRQQTSKYYSGYLVCDDPSCGNRTRQISVYGHRCLGPKGRSVGCLGRMSYEYTEKMLYNQLLYFGSLWDVDKAKRKAMGENKEQVRALAEQNRDRFTNMKGVVDKYLDKCGRQWVQMDGLFGFAA